MMIAALFTAGLGAVLPAPEAGFRCTIDSIRNPGAAEWPEIEQPERFFPLARLTRDGQVFMLEEVLDTPESESFVTHTINGSTGRYAAVNWHNDHVLGEQHRIELAGDCKREG